MKGYHHLNYELRCQIYALNKRGLSHRNTATQLGVHHSTISREIKRNSGRRGYQIKQAHSKAKARRAQNHLHKATPELIAAIEEKLCQQQWSPQQIVGRFKRQGLTCLSHEWIYRHVWADKRRGGTLYKHLRHGGKKYNKRCNKNAGRGCIPGRIDIDQRPSVVQAKERLGDWELDTIIGARHRGAVLSAVERYSKYVELMLMRCCKAKSVVYALEKNLSKYKHLVHTFTMDNGAEFSSHRKISAAFEADGYFAKPYHSWQRGLNEHTNGLVRQYLPKQTDLLGVARKELKQIQQKLNNRPRAVLGFRTPAEVFKPVAVPALSVALGG